MSREAVSNLNQCSRVRTDRDGAASCGSKTLPWTAAVRKQRSLPNGVADGSNGLPTRSRCLFPPIAKPRFDEAGKRLPGPERGLARKRALSKRAEWDLATWREAAAPAWEPKGQVSVA